MSYYDALEAAYLAEYESDTTIPVGSIVSYHGSLEYRHGRYRVIESPTRGFYAGAPGSLALTPDEDDLDQNLYNVRPKSVTLISLPENEEITNG